MEGGGRAMLGTIAEVGPRLERRSNKVTKQSPYASL
jgi:hypothetical protein